MRTDKRTNVRKEGVVRITLWMPKELKEKLLEICKARKEKESISLTSLILEMLK
jgi:hypothetical protein